ARIDKGKITPDAVEDEALALVVDWHRPHSTGQRPPVDDAMPHKLAVELDILFTPGGVFRQREIVHVEAKAGRALGVRAAQRDKPALPASRKNCRLRRDALRVIAEGLMTVGKLAN